MHIGGNQKISILSFIRTGIVKIKSQICFNNSDNTITYGGTTGRGRFSIY